MSARRFQGRIGRAKQSATLPRMTASTAPPVSVLPSRALGRTGIIVSALGLGCAPLGDLYAHIGEEQARATIAAALAAGITLFDVAPLYGHGLAEHRLGAALREQPRGSFILST